jgi:hypothetical protein
MAALLHDRRALAVVLADDDQRAAGDATGRQVRERVARDIGADRRLERHRTAQRVIDRGRQRRGGGGLAGAVLEADAMLGQDVLRVREHVHQVRDRRALIAGDIRHAGFEQRLRDRENAFAAEHLPGTQPKLLHLVDERPLSHAVLSVLSGRARTDPVHAVYIVYRSIYPQS